VEPLRARQYADSRRQRRANRSTSPRSCSPIRTAKRAARWHSRRPFKGSIRGRYEFNIGDYDAFAQVIGTRRAHSLSTTDKLAQDFAGNTVAYDMPGYSTMDASIGVAKDAWNVQLYGTNLTDTRGIVLFDLHAMDQAGHCDPARTLSLRFGYKFSSQ